jgi:hypothetical protein
VGALADEFDKAEQVAELTAACTRLQKQLAKQKDKTAELVAAVYQAAHDAALVVGRPEPVKAPARDRRKASREVAFLHITDTHVGQVTESFNTDVAKQRITATVQKALKLTDIQRADHPISECVVLLGGDLIEQTGQFPNQVWNVDGSTFQQIFDAAGVIQQALLTLLGNFQKVTVYEVPGNHGRVGRGKGRQSLDYESALNWDRIIGKVISDQMADQSRMEWHAADSWYHIIEIGHYRALAHHGDTIRGFGGNIPAYGILRKHLSWASGVMPPFTDAYLGHFHTPMSLPLANGGRVFVTPSLVSDSAFAKEWVASTSVPGQRLHFIDPDKGRVTAEYLIWLD